jgi:hypothetical protein
LVNELATNSKIASKCYLIELRATNQFGLSTNDGDGDDNGDDNQTKTSTTDNIAAMPISNNTTFKLDNVQYSLKITPDISQILFEGDTLELTCQLKRIRSHHHQQQQTSSKNDAFPFSLRNERESILNFYKTQLKWTLNESVIEIIPGRDDLNLDIVQARRRNAMYTIIESKLIIKKSLALNQTGKYGCKTDNLMNNLNLSPRRTDAVDIKILNRKDLLTNIIEPVEQEPLKIDLYCQNFTTITYKGIYKWPQTLANTTAYQKCTIPISAQYPRNTNGTNLLSVSLECQPNGEWSSRIDLTNCDFESALTRALRRLTATEQTIKTHIYNQNGNLDALIRLIVSNNNFSSLNIYDINFIQKYLVVASSISDSDVELFSSLNQPKSLTWRRQFLLLNDMLSRLSPIDLRIAESNDPETFRLYFFKCLLPTVIFDESALNLMTHETDIFSKPMQLSESSLLPPEQPSAIESLRSSYLAITSPILVKSMKIICSLLKFNLSQQLYFKCFYLTPNNNNSSDSSGQLSTTLDRTSFELNINSTEDKIGSNRNQIKVVLFVNDKLFPAMNNQSPLLKNSNNKTTIQTSNETTKISPIQSTCSQIFSLSNGKNFKYDLKLKLKLHLPYSIWKVIQLIQQRLIQTHLNDTNSTHIHNKTKREVSFNLFDQVFSTIQIPTLKEDGNNNTNDESDHKYDSILNDAQGLAFFRSELVNRWFSINNYKIVKAQVGKNEEIIDWETIQDCQLNDFNFSKLNDSLFAMVSCQLIIPDNETFFISIKEETVSTKTTLNYLKTLKNENSRQIINFIDEYSQHFGLILPKKTSLFNEIGNLFTGVDHYELFDHSIVYFCGLFCCLLLFISTFTYIFLSRRLLMPRSFCHTTINIWISIILIILFFIVGIKQTHLPNICLITAIMLHYLTLTTSIWYVLYFYCVFIKLKTLKKRNEKLIKEEKDANSIEFNNNNDLLVIGGGKYIRKSVVHLYILGWIAPALVCLIVIAIMKRNYIIVPFNVCFTNQVYVLVLSVLIPVVALNIIQFIFILLNALTLSQIVKYLVDNNEDIMDEKEDFINKEEENEIYLQRINDQKDELCKNWQKESIQAQADSKNDQDIDADIDLLQKGHSIQIQMNPNTQRSKIIKTNESASNLNGATTAPISLRSPSSSSTSSYYDKNNKIINNNDELDLDHDDMSCSDQTSTMDMQHKPTVQLKVATFSAFVFIFIWIFGACLVTTTTINDQILDDSTLLVMTAREELKKNIFSYMLAFFMVLYSLTQISFFVLSRDDTSCCHGLLARCNFIYKLRWLIANWTHNNKEKRKKVIYKNSNNQNDSISSSLKKVDDKNVQLWQFLDEQEKIYSRGLNSDYSQEEEDAPTNEAANSSGDVEDTKNSICDLIFSNKKEISNQNQSLLSLKSDSQEILETNKMILPSSLPPLPPPPTTVPSSTTEAPMTSSLQQEKPKIKTNRIIAIKKHGRNPSLTGCPAETLQLLTSTSASTNGNTSLASTPTSNEQRKVIDSNDSSSSPCQSQSSGGISKSVSSNLSTKPRVPYVFVDYSYEDKMKSKGLNELNTNNKDSEYSSNINTNGKLNDLLGNNNCSSNIGTAISTLINTVVSSNNFTNMKELQRNNTNHLISTSSSGSGSMTSSSNGLISSSNGINSQQQQQQKQNDLQFKDDDDSIYERLDFGSMSSKRRTFTAQKSDTSSRNTWSSDNHVVIVAGSEFVSSSIDMKQPQAGHLPRLPRQHIYASGQSLNHKNNNQKTTNITKTINPIFKQQNETSV